MGGELCWFVKLVSGSAPVLKKIHGAAREARSSSVHQSPMDSLLSSFQGPPGGQLKLAATAQLGLCIIASTWVADTAGAVAILGILSVVLSNLELLQLFLYVNPATILLDIIQLTMQGSKWWTLLKVIEILVKAGATYFAYNLWQQEASGGEQAGYQAFGGTPTRHARSDPFQAYHPPQSQHSAEPTASSQQQGPASPPPPPPPPPQPHV
ncbi:hypothetical protein WJX74_006377 [Apatococcus lobatus]|uniref:Uncharacterized protein n=2 Tax=Apatococcus TaxID=904362 RepID=A0AAW1T0K2_9CHLO